MNQEFLAILEYMEKEKGIDKNSMIEAIQSALVSASRKALGNAKDIRVAIDGKTAKITVYAKMRAVSKVRIPEEEVLIGRARVTNPDVSLNEEVEVDVTPKDFGRIAAQVFKQTMSHNIRSIERGIIFDEYKDREGDIVAGTVRRFERSDVVVDLGKFEAIMPSSERVPTEEYSIGERVRAMILRVESTPRGPKIILTRSHPDFVRRLFELEVNELVDGTVQIKAMAREAGFRTKIAVWTNKEKVDPVGACVGVRGSRVKNIVRELNNEKIDLFKWSSNIREMVGESLKPAKLKEIILNEADKRVQVLVDEENLSLAIGRRGQNARLASKLIGWEIDVKKEEVEIVGFEQKIGQAAAALALSLKIDKEIAVQVVQAGFLSPEAILETEEQDLIEALPQLTPDQVKQIRESAGSTKVTS